MALIRGIMFLAVVWAVLLAPAAFGQIILTNSTNFTVNLTIPDDGTEVTDIRTVQSDIFALSDIRVSLNISGGYTGDLFAYLRHGSGFSVLLNRVGSTSGNSFGYADAGFDITFDDNAPHDIHLYQSFSNPNGGVLTGSWQPDGRTDDPSVVTDASSRGANFSSFQGLNPNGNWELFLVDNAALGEFVLHNWGMQLTGTVPEPGTIILLGLTAGLGLAMRWRRY